MSTAKWIGPQEAPYALLIIDMQPQFTPSWDEDLQANIIAEVHRAKKDGAMIVVVEYGHTWEGYHHHDTHKEIMEAIGSYRGLYRVEKYTDDGSRQVMMLFEDLDLNEPPCMKVTGVNYGACVQDTVMGLVFQEGVNPETIEVIEDCCREPADWDWEYTTDRFISNGVCVV